MREVVERLIGSRTTRFGSRPCSENLKLMEEQFDECCCEARPLELLTIWGAAKGYNLFETKSADFLDYQAFLRLDQIQTSIKECYSPGIRVTLIFEDYAEFILNGKDCTTYYESLLRLIKGMNLEYIDVFKESSLVGCLRDEKGFRDRVKNNAKSLREGQGETIGWKGEIDWGFYLERCSSEYPEMSLLEKMEQVSLYLGLALARYQVGLIPECDFKFSFCPYPNRVPQVMRRNRLELKIKPNKNSHKIVPPWAGFGLITADEWSFINVNERRHGNFQESLYNTGEITVPVLTP